MADTCNCRSVDECPHKFDGISQEEINETVREWMRANGQVPKYDRALSEGSNG
jgi:hypothetical protein